MSSIKRPTKKIDVQKDQIDFIAGAEREPLEWNEYPHDKRTSNNLRLSKRESEMIAGAAKKLGKELGIKVSKQDYLIKALHAALRKDLGVSPDDLD